MVINILIFASHNYFYCIQIDTKCVIFGCFVPMNASLGCGLEKVFHKLN